MTPKYSPILWWLLKISNKSSYPKIIFLKITKIMKFKTSDAKNDPSLRVYENIKEPPWGRLCFWNFLPLVDGILNWKCILQYGFKGSAVAQSVECLTRDRGFEPHQRHCLVSLSKNINPSLVLVQPRKTRPFITEILLMGCKESNQTKNKQKSGFKSCTHVYFSIWLSALRRQFPLRCPHWLH